MRPSRPRSLAIAGLAAVALALAACSSGSSQAASTSATHSSNCKNSPNAKSKLMVIITPPPSNIFFKFEQVYAAAQAKALGYQTLVLNNNDDPTTQYNEVGTAIARHAAAIILDNAGSQSTIAAVQKAKAACVPSFLIDREIDQSGIAVAQIVSNNFQGATLGGQEFSKLMGYKGQYAELLGLPTDTNSATRSQGFLSVIHQYPKMKMVAQQAANWDQTTAYNDVQTILQAHPDLKGVVALNDTMAQGAWAALQQAHKTNVVVIGMDGSPYVVSSIRNGGIKATVMQPVKTFTALAVQEANRYIKTGSTGKPEKQLINCILITSANASKAHNFSVSG
jgi:erythritol transport system substrate-binding protein